MKSPEQMGGLPEQPNEEEKAIEDREKMPEKQESIESYNKEEWEKLKKSPANAIDKGKEIGVPQEEIEQFAQDIIKRETEEQNYDFVFRFRKNMKIGTEEEIRAVGEQAYIILLEKGNPISAMKIAEEIYGKNSEEWKHANKANETKRKKTEEKIKEEEGMEDEEKELTVSISKDATFADLFNAIDSIEEKEGLDELYFEEELANNFNPKIEEEILAFRDAQASKAGTVKILDFFKERGYSQKDISAFLPIKFKQERKKKK